MKIKLLKIFLYMNSNVISNNIYNNFDEILKENDFGD